MESLVENQNDARVNKEQMRSSIVELLTHNWKVRWFRRIILIILSFLIFISILGVIGFAYGMESEICLMIYLPRRVLIVGVALVTLTYTFGVIVVYRLHETGLKIFFGMWLNEMLGSVCLFWVFVECDRLGHTTQTVTENVAHALLFVIQAIILILTWALIKIVAKKARALINQA